MTSGSKLLEALEDLRDKRRKIDDAIHHLSAAVSALGIEAEVEPQIAFSARSHKRSGLSLIDHCILLLRHGPMAVVALAKAVSEATGREVSRATLDGGISREIREDPERSRFVRVEPAIYALSEAGALYVRTIEERPDVSLEGVTLMKGEAA